MIFFITRPGIFCERGDLHGGARPERSSLFLELKKYAIISVHRKVQPDRFGGPTQIFSQVHLNNVSYNFNIESIKGAMRIK